MDWQLLFIGMNIIVFGMLTLMCFLRILRSEERVIWTWAFLGAGLFTAHLIFIALSAYVFSYDAVISDVMILFAEASFILSPLLLYFAVYKKLRSNSF